MEKIPENPRNKGVRRTNEINLPNINSEKKLNKFILSNKIKSKGRNYKYRGTKSIDLENEYRNNSQYYIKGYLSNSNQSKVQENLNKFGIGIYHDSTVVHPVFAPHSKIGIFIDL